MICIFNSLASWFRDIFRSFLSWSRFRFIALFVVIVFAGGLATPALAADAHSVIAPLASRSLLLDLVAIDGMMVAVGERGHILISHDNGHKWRQMDVPTRANLTGVFFHNKTLGWVVGHDQIILRTEDGGETWQQVYANPTDNRPLFDIWFKDKTHGFAVGAYGLFLVTEDGGQTWKESLFSPEESSISEDKLPEDEDYEEINDYHLNDISRSASGRLYISAEAGHIYRSDDDGLSWTCLPSPYVGSFFGSLPLENDTLLIFGLRGHLYRSENAGESWQQVDVATQAMLTSGLQLNDGSILITGLAGTLLVSVDAGKSFSLHQQPGRKSITRSAQAADGSVVIVGGFGVKTLTEGVNGLRSLGKD